MGHKNDEMDQFLEICFCCPCCCICKAKCPQGAIKIRQTMPMRSDIKEYFREEFSLDLDLFD